MRRLEAKCSAGVSGHKQLMEASGAVLIDIEMTIKLMTQGKVRTQMRVQLCICVDLQRGWVNV